MIFQLCGRWRTASSYFFFDDFFALLFFAADFFFGTFAPALRASDNPIAIACLRLVTFFPLRPLFSVPLFFSRITFSTFFPAFGLYFLPDDFFFAAIERSPFCCMGSSRRYSGCAKKSSDEMGQDLTRNSSGRQNILDVHPLRRILTRIAGHAIAIPLTTIARVPQPIQ